MKLVSVVVVVLVPVLASCSKDKPVDCSEIHKYDSKKPSGVYTIYPTGAESDIEVYCDMDSLGGGWTVIQRRMDGSVNFYRPWVQYKDGFGCPNGEYWIGLDNMHDLTHGRKIELLVDMEDFKGKKVYARYTSFSVGGENTGYLLKISGFKNGGAGNSMAWHNGQKFSTFDKDQDKSSSNSAMKYVGAWWYSKCHSANPNGVYRWGASRRPNYIGVQWVAWRGLNYSLKAISMKIRPVQ